MLGKIVVEDDSAEDIQWVDPAKVNLVAEVSIQVRDIL